MWVASNQSGTFGDARLRRPRQGRRPRRRHPGHHRHRRGHGRRRRRRRRRARRRPRRACATSATAGPTPTAAPGSGAPSRDRVGADPGGRGGHAVMAGIAAGSVIVGGSVAGLAAALACRSPRRGRPGRRRSTRTRPPRRPAPTWPRPAPLAPRRATPQAGALPRLPRPLPRASWPPRRPTSSTPCGPPAAATPTWPPAAPAVRGRRPRARATADLVVLARPPVHVRVRCCAGRSSAEPAHRPAARRRRADAGRRPADGRRPGCAAWSLDGAFGAGPTWWSTPRAAARRAGLARRHGAPDRGRAAAASPTSPASTGCARRADAAAQPGLHRTAASLRPLLVPGVPRRRRRRSRSPSACCPRTAPLRALTRPGRVRRRRRRHPGARPVGRPRRRRRRSPTCASWRRCTTASAGRPHRDTPARAARRPIGDAARHHEPGPHPGHDVGRCVARRGRGRRRRRARRATRVGTWPTAGGVRRRASWRPWVGGLDRARTPTAWPAGARTERRRDSQRSLAPASEQRRRLLAAQRDAACGGASPGLQNTLDQPGRRAGRPAGGRPGCGRSRPRGWSPPPARARRRTTSWSSWLVATRRRRVTRPADGVARGRRRRPLQPRRRLQPAPHRGHRRRGGRRGAPTCSSCPTACSAATTTTSTGG